MLAMKNNARRVQGGDVKLCNMYTYFKRAASAHAAAHGKQDHEQAK